MQLCFQATKNTSLFVFPPPLCPPSQNLDLTVDLIAMTVTNNGLGDADNFAAFSSGANECGLTILSAAESHLGEWNCLINEGETPSISGVFQLLPAVEDNYLKDGLM